MMDVLWGSLAVSVLALSGALIAYVLTLRCNAKKFGESLDALNRELPDILAAIRAASEDIEATMILGRKLGGILASLGGLFKGAKFLSGLFAKRHSID